MNIHLIKVQLSKSYLKGFFNRSPIFNKITNILWKSFRFVLHGDALRPS